MRFKEYRQKRHFRISREPSGKKAASKKASSETSGYKVTLRFSSEQNGTLLFMGRAEGPSIDPSVKPSRDAG
jgi:hypothetical protein